MSAKIGIVICTRTDSSRLPGKPFLKVNGKYLICHLLDRLMDTGITVCLAVPKCDEEEYRRRLSNYISSGNDVYLYSGNYGDPLKRMRNAAEKFGFDHVIRICHDKIFIDYRQLEHFITLYNTEDYDYLYSTNFIPGMAFEIFGFDLLEKAHRSFDDVEHISYAIESVSKKPKNVFAFPLSRSWLRRKKPKSSLRLLIDYPEDLVQISNLLEKTEGGREGRRRCNITDIVDLIEDEIQPNALPEVSVYTCCYNDADYLDRCISSVLGQSVENIEYILIDDGSSDIRVRNIMLEWCSKDWRIKTIIKSNEGLATSSNLATRTARGRFVVRIDADDHFVDAKVIERMVRQMNDSNADILYPHNYRDYRIQKGCEEHHVGGAMFTKRCLEFLRFSDGLRHFEGKDLYKRATIANRKIEYFHEPTFHYRNKPGSLSNTPTPEREQVMKKLAAGFSGEKLL